MVSVLFLRLERRCEMNEVTQKQKNKLVKKLKQLGLTTEKDILNIKVSDLRKKTADDKMENWTMKDIEIIWLMQEAIENKNLLGFFVDND